MPGPSSLSLERKLPLLISILLVALAGGLTAAGYHEVRQTSELRAIDRLQRLTSQLAELASVTQQQRYESLQRVAADSAVIAHLVASAPSETTRAAALTAFRGLPISPADTAIIAELRSAHEARRVATHAELPDDEPISALTAILSKGRPAMGPF